MLTDELVVGGGTPTATAEQARIYLRTAPNRLLTGEEASEIVNAFVHWGGLVGVRWDLAFAQSAHETNLYRFGNQVALVQRNPAGIGATNDGSPGLTFPTWTQGIAAMLIHLLAWTDRLDLARLIHRVPTDLDPRIPIVAQVRAEKGAATTWASLGGRWAVPGVGYGAAIARHHSAIMAIGQEPPSMDALAPLATRQILMPASNANWGKTTMRGGWPSWITVHEVGNTKPGANAEMHANFVKNGGGEHGVSFHACVDEKESIQIMPWNWVAWHASDGNGDGNFDSIAIETCQIGDFAKTVRRLGLLIVKLMVEFDIPLSNVVQHNHWAPDKKNCPQLLREGGHGASWGGLLAAVNTAYKVLTNPPPPAPSGMMSPIITERQEWGGKGKLISEEVTVQNIDTGEYYSRKKRHEAAGVVLEDWREV